MSNVININAIRNQNGEVEECINEIREVLEGINELDIIWNFIDNIYYNSTLPYEHLVIDDFFNISFELNGTRILLIKEGDKKYKIDMKAEEISHKLELRGTNDNIMFIEYIEMSSEEDNRKSRSVQYLKMGDEYKKMQDIVTDGDRSFIVRYIDKLTNDGDIPLVQLLTKKDSYTVDAMLNGIIDEESGDYIFYDGFIREGNGGIVTFNGERCIVTDLTDIKNIREKRILDNFIEKELMFCNDEPENRDDMLLELEGYLGIYYDSVMDNLDADNILKVLKYKGSDEEYVWEIELSDGSDIKISKPVSLSALYRDIFFAESINEAGLNIIEAETTICIESVKGDGTKSRCIYTSSGLEYWGIEIHDGDNACIININMEEHGEDEHSSGNIYLKIGTNQSIYIKKLEEENEYMASSITEVSITNDNESYYIYQNEGNDMSIFTEKLKCNIYNNGFGDYYITFGKKEEDSFLLSTLDLPSVFESWLMNNSLVKDIEDFTVNGLIFTITSLEDMLIKCYSKYKRSLEEENEG